MREEQLQLNESQPVYGFVNKSEDEKLWDEWNRPFIDKIQSFTLMLRRNKTLDKFFTRTNSDIWT